MRGATRAGGPIVSLIVLALAIRLAIAALPIVHHEDEIWQYLEPAWGRLTGHWIETWDMRAGIRSWLMTVLLMPPLALGRLIGPGVGVMLARMAMGFASLGVVWAFWRIGGRSGRSHALIAGFVAATWVEIAYFGPRTSSDSLALSLLLPTLALIREPQDRRRDALAGLLGGLALMTRLQLAPVLGVALLGLWWRQPLRWRALALGMAGGLLLDALANAAMGEWPFAWVWRNVTVNLVQDKASMFGTAPPIWYVERLGEGWDLALLLLAPAIVIGARREPVLLAAGIVQIATMTLIPHKEYRFITIGVALLVMVAAIGSVDLVLAGRGPRRRALAWLMAVWLGASALVATGPIFSAYWTQGMSRSIALVRAGQTPGLCGIAVYRHPTIPLPAYSLIGRNVPVLMIDDWLADRTSHPPLLSSAWNVALAPGSAAAELAQGGYRQTWCGASHYPPDPQGFCVYVRPGGCTRAPGYFLYNAGLIRQQR